MFQACCCTIARMFSNHFYLFVESIQWYYYDVEAVGRGGFSSKIRIADRGEHPHWIGLYSDHYRQTPEIPEDPKTIWGFDGGDVEHAAVRARLNP